MIDNNAITLQVSWHRYAPTIQSQALRDAGAAALNIANAQARGTLSLIRQEFTKPLQDVERKGRTVLERNTLVVGPLRVLPTANFIHFQQEWTAHLSEWDAARRDFIDRYEGEILPKSQSDFNGYLHHSKWIHPYKLADRIRIDRDQFPFGSATSVANLSHLDEQTKVAMEADVARSVKAATIEAQSQVRDRLRKVLQDFVAKMEQYGDGVGKKLYPTIVSNIQGVVDIIPRLLVGEDQEILELCHQAQAVSAWDVEILKDSEAARDGAKENAESILKAMAL